ncbi:hypothetical protein BV22DRAFT_1015894 [Leucogyrophana mollusca]|uniref:Uncharacterized protein n=1 Tax=Leucogyrophana mollusca TaxID=85980 RepID=A0ACB8BBV8_9AGAM|nr:hypothetical protein BV22DRAFT_1015894 [Leucogyrophana mollusca]
MLENFSRTVRNYVPTSIPVPIAAPSPARVSRPVSFGSFLVPPGGATVGTPTTHRGSGSHTRRSSGQPTWRIRGGVQFDSAEVDDAAVFGSEDEDQESTFAGDQRLTSYPTVGEGDTIMWSRWDTLSELTLKPQRLLFLGYSSGFQLWNCTNLGSVSEVLNLSGPSWGLVTFAGVLASPRVSDKDQIGDQRPLIGVVSKVRDQSTMSVYSLRSHQVVKRFQLPNVSTFVSNSNFTIISTFNPSTLHILSSASFTVLHTIASPSLFPYAHSSPLTFKLNTNNYNIVSSPDIEHDSEPSSSRHNHSLPVYSLSHRLLAFTSPPPAPESFHGVAAQPRTHKRLSSSSRGISQADLGNAAIKVGGSVLSGMKFLGGMAYNAAAEYAKSGPAGEQGRVSNLFFSRSAPAASGSHSGLQEQSVSSPRAGSPYLQPSGQPSTHSPPTHAGSAAGYYVTVVDLAPLLKENMSSSSPHTVAEFVALKHQPAVHLKFTHDGNSLIVSPRDGQVIRMFQIRPSPTALIQTLGGAVGDNVPWHIYNLRRGHTSAVIEGVELSPDGRWAAVGTRKHTVHIFPINPYGGAPDPRSHLEGRVWNAQEIQPLSTEVAPIVRLRSSKAVADGPRAPLAFTFLSVLDPALPASLLPPMGGGSSPSPSLGRPEPPSPRRVQRLANFQDILMFDPLDGVLSLRRITLEPRPRDQGPSFSAPFSNFGASVSLPGTGAAGRLGVSPPSRGGGARNKSSGLTQMMEASTELAGRESTVATWQLRRRQDWGEIRNSLQGAADSSSENAVRKPNSLAHAELSTCSKAPGMLPRSIYLAHQFSFHTLGEDYHALIRRYQLDVAGNKLEVRKEVEVSAYSAGTGESFVEGFSAPRDVRRATSSFDEPIASAISADLGRSHSPRTIIPMLPNGTPGSKPKSFKNSIPIRNMTAGITEGMGESLGRIRREIHKVRSPQFGPRPDSSLSGSVPLEFDEQDEDFLYQTPKLDEPNDETPSRSTSRGEGDSGGSVSTPSTNLNPLEDDGDDLWRGWNEEDKKAIDEAEQFDDVVGFLDEEQTPSMQAERKKASRRQRW